MTRPVLITVAPNGARKLKQDHPQLPLTAYELGETAAACSAAG
ncbi:MAG TPA: class III aminotransferase, partial [Gammaproteobacteria bacterium]|nr:class III aminotransferase [Gammaproteobacteria bacterium]